MRRGLISLAALALLAPCFAAQPAAAKSWAQPQIRTVVESGLMGPSVRKFHPKRHLTRSQLGAALAAFTGEAQVVVDPTRPVTLSELDGAVVEALGLPHAAHLFRRKVKEAGLGPPGRLGNEVVARLLWLRYNHPLSDDDLELRPQDPATRAEAAYSLARALELSDWDRAAVTSLADSFSLPEYDDWRRRVLRRAVHFIGYPYVWGGTSENEQVTFGVTSRGGFDCSGFVWRVYKRPFPGGGSLASVLQGRTTYQMSGEVPRAKRIPFRRVRPADVVFFGAHGPRSRPSEVDHMGLSLGNGWMIHSSSQGVAFVPLEDWYRDRFAWARRPLHEAGLL